MFFLDSFALINLRHTLIDIVFEDFEVQKNSPSSKIRDHLGVRCPSKKKAQVVQTGTKHGQIVLVLVANAVCVHSRNKLFFGFWGVLYTYGGFFDELPQVNRAS